jgi:hypothetical protein
MPMKQEMVLVRDGKADVYERTATEWQCPLCNAWVRIDVPAHEHIRAPLAVPSDFGSVPDESTTFERLTHVRNGTEKLR